MEDRRAARSAPNAADGCGEDKCTRPESSIRTPGEFARLLLLLTKTGPWSWLKEPDNEFARRKGACGYFYICIFASAPMEIHRGLRVPPHLLHWENSGDTPCRHQAGTEGSSPPKIPSCGPAHREFPPLTLTESRAAPHHELSAGMCLLNKINAKRQKQNSPLELQGRCLIQHFILFSPLFFFFA